MDKNRALSDVLYYKQLWSEWQEVPLIRPTNSSLACYRIYSITQGNYLHNWRVIQECSKNHYTSLYLLTNVLGPSTYDDAFLFLWLYKHLRIVKIGPGCSRESRDLKSEYFRVTSPFSARTFLDYPPIV